jgi:NAD(P)-dependent dehydrogenase (short-subunit alcohol dehydrogenase family)
MAPKTILFTGVTSGFGRLAVPLLLAKGHRVIAGIRGGQERLETVYEAEHLATGRLTAIDLHMERSETFASVREHIDAHHDGQLDVLINNAGYGVLAPLEDIGDAELRKQMEVNFYGPILLTKALLDPLREARGRVLFVTSSAGLMSFPYYGIYSASKHALEAAAEAWRVELAPFGVQVGLIEPGGYKTRFTDVALSAVAIPEDSRYAAKSEAFNEFIADAARKGAGNPIVVAKKLSRLTDCRRVPVRTLSGPDAWATETLRRLVPFRLRAWLVDLVFRKLVWKGR